MQYHIQLQHLPAHTPTAVVRRQATGRDLATVVPQACGIVWNALKARHITGAGRHVALYLGDAINLEVGVELPAPFSGHGQVIPSTLPAGHVATTTHFGPYPKLHHAHRAILDWAKNHGHTLAGPNWEIYGHWEDAWNTDPSLIRTDVFYLLASA